MPEGRKRRREVADVSKGYSVRRDRTGAMMGAMMKRDDGMRRGAGLWALLWYAARMNRHFFGNALRVYLALRRGCTRAY